MAALGYRRHAVIAYAESNVAFACDRTCIWEVIADKLGRVVDGSVIVNDDFEREITFLRIDRCEAIKHHAATVVVGYAHADIDRVVLIVHVTGAGSLLVG